MSTYYALDIVIFLPWNDRQKDIIRKEIHSLRRFAARVSTVLLDKRGQIGLLINPIKRNQTDDIGKPHFEMRHFEFILEMETTLITDFINQGRKKQPGG